MLNETIRLVVLSLVLIAGRNLYYFSCRYWRRGRGVVYEEEKRFTELLVRDASRRVMRRCIDMTVFFQV